FWALRDKAPGGDASGDDSDEAEGGHRDAGGHRRADADAEGAVAEPRSALGHAHSPVEGQQGEESREDRVDKEMRLLDLHHGEGREQGGQQADAAAEEAPADQGYEQDR